jgi:hypothetical protein
MPGKSVAAISGYVFAVTNNPTTIYDVANDVLKKNPGAGLNQKQVIEQLLAQNPALQFFTDKVLDRKKVKEIRLNLAAGVGRETASTAPQPRPPKQDAPGGVSLGTSPPALVGSPVGGASGTAAPAPNMKLGRIDWSSPVIPPDKIAPFPPSQAALTTALKAYETANAKDQINNPFLTIVDYSMSSGQPRMWVVDMTKRKVFAQTWVAHGEGSSNPPGANNPKPPSTFSNHGGTHKSNLGVLTTGGTYTGEFGYSLKLKGREPGFNDNAAHRTIVMHPWGAVAPVIAKGDGCVGPTQGCLGLYPAISERIIDTIAGGSVILCYYPDAEYLRESRYVGAGR